MVVRTTTPCCACGGRGDYQEITWSSPPDMTQVECHCCKGRGHVFPALMRASEGGLLAESELARRREALRVAVDMCGDVDELEIAFGAVLSTDYDGEFP